MYWTRLTWDNWDTLFWDDWDGLEFKYIVEVLLNENLGIFQDKGSILPTINQEFVGVMEIAGIKPEENEILILDIGFTSPRVKIFENNLIIESSFDNATKIKNTYTFLTLGIEYDLSETILINPSDNNEFASLVTVYETNVILNRLISESLLCTTYFIPIIYSDLITYHPYGHLNRTYYGSTILLEHGELSLTLPTPIFNDTHSLHLTRVQRESRGGTQIVFSDPIWPKVETFDWNFEGLTKAQRDNFLDFLNNTLGLEITITDWEERTWTGIFIKTQDETSEVLRECGYTINITFEGIQV